MNFARDRFLVQSACAHGFLILVTLGVIYGTKDTSEKPEVVKFTVIEKPVVQEKEVEIEIKTANQQKVEEKPKKEKVNEVFGINRKAITSQKDSAVKTKKGNTITKEVDQKKLKDTDPDELPIPKPEYLVTEMPSVKSKARIRYPDRAKQLELEGVVVLSVLIDSEGNVRDAKVLEGLIEEMDTEALRAIKQYKFSPAKIDKDSVAVRIRYAVRFVLE